MAKVSLKRLVLNNFRSFKGRHELDLPERGLVILRGASGAGKTNVLLALAYAFGFCSLAVKDLQCWSDEDPVYVEVTVSTAGGDVTFRRGAKGLSLGRLRGKSAEAKLDEICGVPQALREALTYRDQVNPQLFMGMTDPDKKRFLVNVLKELQQAERDLAARSKSFSSLERVREEDAAAVAQAEERVAREAVDPFVPEDMSLAEEELRDLLSRRDEAAELSRDMEARAIALGEEEEAEALAAAARHSDRADEICRHRDPDPEPVAGSPELDRHRRDLEKCDALSAALSAADARARAAHDAATAALATEARALHNELARAAGLVDDVRRLEREVESLSADVCPGCGRQWESAAEALRGRSAELDERRVELERVRSHRERSRELDEAVAARAFSPDPRLERLARARVEILTRIAAEEQRLAQAHGVARAQVALLRAERSAQVLRLREQARSAYASFPRPSRELRAQARAMQEDARSLGADAERVRHGIELARERNRAGLAAHDAQVRRLAEAEAWLAKVRAQADGHEEEYRRESDYLDLLRGFRNKYFDEVLSAIGAEATAIVAHLPNASNLSLEFRTERENQDGEVVERITPVCYVGGRERPLRAAVSGGQLTSVNLAVDLAVARVISARLGCSLNWVILDESFDGHDVPTKQACLEMLQGYAADKLVLIVDHGSEFKEMFTRSFEVVQEAGQSRLA